MHAGEAGTQLTWMDAKHGDQVFTPRIGKAVEINALWLNALSVMVRLAGRVRNPSEKRFCESLLKRASGELWTLLERGAPVSVRCHRRGPQPLWMNA